MKKLNKKGFTIVELVIVIAVIAILAAVLIPTFSDVVAKANKVAIDETLSGAYTMYTIDVADSGFAYKAKTDVIFGYDGDFYKLIDGEYVGGQDASTYTAYKNIDTKKVYVECATSDEARYKYNDAEVTVNDGANSVKLASAGRFTSGTNYYTVNEATATLIDLDTCKYIYNDVTIYVKD